DIAEDRTAMGRHPEEPGDAEGSEDDDLDEETFERLGADDLLEITVARKAHREEERHPGHEAEREGEIENGGGGKGDGELLRARQALAQKQDAREHAHQRIDEIAKA